MNNIKFVEKEPLSDDTIKKYLPECRIIKYSQFKNYKDIKELLPNNKDYVIILYQNIQLLFLLHKHNQHFQILLI
jgi:tRNA A37 threonylcarbamoyladenosine dehydratase